MSGETAGDLGDPGGLGGTLRRHRLRQDLTLEWVADRSGVTKQAISDFELVDSRGVHYAPTIISRLYERDGYSKLGGAFPTGVALLTELYFDVAPGTAGMRVHLLRPDAYVRLE